VHKGIRCVERQRLLQLPARLLILPAAKIVKSQILVWARQLGIQARSLLVVLVGFVDAPTLGLGDAALVRQRSIGRAQTPGILKLLQCLLVFLLLEKLKAPLQGITLSKSEHSQKKWRENCQALLHCGKALSVVILVSS
jgi:hypothetical protein